MEKNLLKDTTVLLFTELFPFGINSEKVFLQHEISYLVGAFKKVIIFPHLIEEEQTTSGNFIVVKKFERCLRKRNKSIMLFYALTQLLFYEELFTKKISFWNLPRIKRLTNYIARSALTKKWFQAYISENKLKHSNLLIYSYWNDEVITGLLGCKFNVPNAYYISRAHGHDLNEDYWGYIPCRGYNLAKLDRLFLVSNHAMEYVRVLYPGMKDKLALSYLGVKPSAKPAAFSTDGIVRIVSCSSVVKVTSIDLVANSLARYASQYHNKVEWIHFGDGLLMPEIRSLADTLATPSFKINLPGFLPNERISQFYMDHPVDLFIHLSESEGVPLAIQEAQAHGIPVIATKVGGIPEIINSEVGILLPVSSTEDEIADTIFYITQERERFLLMRGKSFENWSLLFDEKKNYPSFINLLKELLMNTPYNGH